MARIKQARLRADGEGREAVLTVELEIDWSRRDDDHRWEAVIRFIGADTLLRGGDDVVKVHTVAIGPGQGEQFSVEVANSDGAFDEDRGGEDEILAECSLHIVDTDVEPVKTNKVKGRF